MNEEGVWVVYFHDSQPIVSRIYEMEIDALRNAVEDHHDVCFIPFGASVSEVIAERYRIAQENYLANREKSIPTPGEPEVDVPDR